MNLSIRTFAEGLRYSLVVAFAGSVILLSACMVGPNYQRPTASVPAEYKEPPPDNFKEVGQWKQAEPNDGMIRGKWWEIFNDPELNELEEQVNLSNQNILAAEAQFRGAREAVRITRSGLFPTVGVNPSIISSRTSTPVTNNPVSGVRTAYILPFEISYIADLWGSIRRSVTASAENAQVSAAQLENARLAFHAELAQLYFELRGVDGDQELLESTVKSYEDYLHLTEDRYSGGVASGGDVAQAQTQLDTARAQLIDLGVARAQFEHAIAILIGKPPSALTIPHRAINSQPPLIPVGVPSTLLERRPDIAGAERQMASANEQIGIAKAAYYPTLTLMGSAGLASTDFTTWFTWPSRLWSVGPQLAETLFDAGKRRAQVGLAQADYETTVANYRQTVLTGFQQVEDHLATLRILENEARVEEEAVRAAKDSLNISTYQYKGGTASYLQVIISQTIAFQNERSSLDILARRMVASVLLIQALGGGWDASNLPTTTELVHGK